MAGLDALGPAAEDALPALEKLLREKPPDPQALYVVARIGPAGLPVLTKAVTNEVRVLRLEARVCLEMIKTHSEVLYGEVGAGPGASSFDRRICEFNVRVLRAAFEDYRAQHPDQAWPASIDERPPPSLPPDLLQNSQSIQNDTASRMTNISQPRKIIQPPWTSR